MKATDISAAVRAEVYARDKRCIVCGKQGIPNAHVFVSRAHGGLGVKENVATLCMKCHHDFDNGRDKDHYRVKQALYEYMYRLYPNLDVDKLKVRK